MKLLALLILINLSIFSLVSSETKGVLKLRIEKTFTNGLLKFIVGETFKSINKKLPTEYTGNYGYLFRLSLTKLKIQPLVFDENKINIDYQGDSDMVVNISNIIILTLENFELIAESDLSLQLLYLFNGNGTMKVKLNLNILAKLKLTQDSEKNFLVNLDSFSFDYYGTALELRGSFLLRFVELTERVLQLLNLK